MHPTTSPFETFTEIDRRTSVIRRSAFNDERSDSRWVIHAAAGESRNVRRNKHEKLARVSH
jgi:hypothetical protein